MTERECIRKDLYEFFEDLLRDQGLADMPLIYGGENGPRPKAPFLMLDFRSVVSLGLPEKGMVTIGEDGSETQRITQHMRQHMTMHGFGERAVAALETVKAHLNADIWIDRLRMRGLVIPRTMESVESPKAFDTMREDGASFDFDLTYPRVTVTSPGYIENMELNPNFIRQR